MSSMPATGPDSDYYMAESSDLLGLHDETLTLIEEGSVGVDDDDSGSLVELAVARGLVRHGSSATATGIKQQLPTQQQNAAATASSVIVDGSSQHRLKRTVMTILLTHKWQKVYPGRKAKKRAAKKSIKYEPTYRMEPKVNVASIKYLIEAKARHTFESLVDKHGKYDVEYTPRFLRIITEMIKNDVKSFRIDRYKVVVNVLILKKVMHQSAQFVSQALLDYDNDHRICLNVDTKSFYAVCLIFLVYHE